MQTTKTARILTAVAATFGFVGTVCGVAQHSRAATAPIKRATQDALVAPELIGGPWVGEPTTLAANRGKVVLLTFWTNQCINCKRTLPYWNHWAKKYGAAGKSSDVAVVSVHTPELASERLLSGVQESVKRNGILFPVLTDNASKNWNAYNVQVWPTTILIDKQGRIRNRWEGELDWENSGEYKRVGTAIEALRREK